MTKPVFGILALTSGSYEGAIIRDIRLANELAKRGYEVHVYWMMERNADLVDPAVHQHVLVGGMRWQFSKPNGIFERLGRALQLLPANQRREFMQRHPRYVDRIMGNYVQSMCRGADADGALVRRLATFIARDKVTHLLPTFAMTCPYALAAKKLNLSKFEYLVTFQGEEIFANYAEMRNCLPEYHKLLQEVVENSTYPAIAVSRDYIDRLNAEMGIPKEKMTAIYPGIEWPDERKIPDFDVLKPKFPKLNRESPIVTYIGRQDSEKGIDLLLYAARMLQDEGVKMQLVICGGTSFGQRYRDVISHMAQHLRVPIHHRRRIPGAMRDALYHYSHCIVYPSIHREPFGMVAAEALSRGTPVLVPNLGGVVEAIRQNGQSGGLTFNAWDSADLAKQLKRLLTDENLRQELVNDAKSVAGNFTIGAMTDAILRHLSLENQTVKG